MTVYRELPIETDTFQNNDRIEFKLVDGEPVTAIAIRTTTSGALFITEGCLVENQPMFRNTDSISEESIDYIHSDLRFYLNNIIAIQFPKEIRERMVRMKVGDNCYDTLRLPTEKEITGYNEYGNKESDRVKQLDYFKKRRNRISGQAGRNNWYWLQNKLTGTTASFVNINGNGDKVYSYATSPNGIRLVFLLSNGE